jgi:L-threonylcarbamoyladenylate synthase
VGVDVVAPTDTVYGLYAEVTNAAAVERFFAVRAASWDAPPTVLIHNARNVSGIAQELTEPAERLIAAYWPGPLTLVFAPRAGIDWVLGDHAVVAVRMPAEPLPLQVLYDVGPLACTGAGVAGGPPPTTAAEARECLGDQVSLYIDDGPRHRTPSTVVDMTRGSPDVVREGAIATADIAAVADGQLDWGQTPDGEQENGTRTTK